MKRETNFDRYLAEHLKDPDFAERFRKAGETWDEVIQESNARDAKNVQRAGVKSPGSSVQDPLSSI